MNSDIPKWPAPRGPGLPLALCMLAVLAPVFCPREPVLTSSLPLPPSPLLHEARFPPIAFSNCTSYVNDVV